MVRNLGKKVKDIFSGAEVGVLVEHFTSQVEFVGEGVLELNKTMDKVEKRLDRVEGDIGTIKMNVEVIKMDISVIKNDLKNKVSRDEFAILERKVALPENRAS